MHRLPAAAGQASAQWSPAPRALSALSAVAALALASHAVAFASGLARGPGAVASSRTQALTKARVAGRGRVEVLSLRDPASGRLHRVWVYRPDVPDSSTLPVLYFLHGVPGGGADVFRAGLAQSLDRRFAHGGLPFVMVAPDGNGARTDSEWVDAADGRDRLESFVTQVVVPAVEGDHARDRAHRAIAGFSMGGYGAYNIAEHHAQMFGQAVSVAGYFHVDDPDGALGAGAAAIARNSPDRHLDALRGMHLLLLDSAHDTQPVVRGESQRMEGLLTRAGIAATLEVAAGAHDWRYVSSQFGAIERFLQAGWDS